MTPTEREVLVRRLSTQLESQLREGIAGATEQILGSNPEIFSDVEAALDLIYVEITTREEMGQLVQVEDLGRRFPDWVDRIERLFSVHQALQPQSGTDHRDTQRLMFDTEVDVEHRFADWSPNRIEQYEIQEELGRGGMGVVYKALQPELNRIVAIKVIRDTFGTGESGQRLIHEAKTVARLDHPQIVRVYDAGYSDGLPFVSLEFVDGGSLDDKLSLATLDANSACSMLKLLADAVEYAHGQGVIHRDLKPANILLDTLGHPKIADFGLAKTIWEQTSDKSSDRLTQSGAILGSLCYMSPEQVSGRDADIGPQSDIYGLGTILYEALVGRPPFFRESPVETAQDILNRSPVALRTLVPNIPRDVETICLKCLEKSPHRRFASAAELGKDLERFLTGQPIHSRPISNVTRAWQWGKRKPAQAALLACAIAIPLTYGFVQREHATALREINSQLDTSLESETNARRQADSRFWIAFEAVAQVQSKLAGAGLEHEPRMQKAQLEIVDQALEIIKNLDGERPAESRIRKEMGKLLKLRGHILLRQGRFESALAAFEQCEATYEALIAKSPSDDELRHSLAATTAGKAATLKWLMRDDEAEVAYATANSELRRLAIALPDNATVQLDFEQVLCSLGGILLQGDRNDEAEALLNEGRQRSDASVLRWPDESRAHSVRAQTLRTLAKLAQSRGEPAEAAALVADSIADFERALHIAPGDRNYENFIVEASIFHAELLQRLRRFEQAREALLRAERLVVDLQGRYPSIRHYAESRIAIFRAQSFLEVETGNEVLAVELSGREVDQRRDIVKLDPDDPLAATEFAVSLCLHANRLVVCEDMEESRYLMAESLSREALAVFEQHDVGDAQKRQIGRLANYVLALALARQNRVSETGDVLQQLKALTSTHPVELRFFADAWSECLAALLRTQGSQEAIENASEQTLLALEEAVNAGFSDYQEVLTQPLLDPLVDNPRFVKLLARIKRQDSQQ